MPGYTLVLYPTLFSSVKHTPLLLLLQLDGLSIHDVSYNGLFRFQIGIPFLIKILAFHPSGSGFFLFQVIFPTQSFLSDYLDLMQIFESQYSEQPTTSFVMLMSNYRISETMFRGGVKCKFAHP